MAVAKTLAEAVAQVEGVVEGHPLIGRSSITRGSNSGEYRLNIDIEEGARQHLKGTKYDPTHHDNAGTRVNGVRHDWAELAQSRVREIERRFAGVRHLRGEEHEAPSGCPECDRESEESLGASIVEEVGQVKYFIEVLEDFASGLERLVKEVRQDIEKYKAHPHSRHSRHSLGGEDPFSQGFGLETGFEAIAKIQQRWWGATRADLVVRYGAAADAAVSEYLARRNASE